MWNTSLANTLLRLSLVYPIGNSFYADHEGFNSFPQAYSPDYVYFRGPYYII